MTGWNKFVLDDEMQIIPYVFFNILLGSTMILIAKQLNVLNKEKNLVLLKCEEVKSTLGNNYNLGLWRIFTVFLYTWSIKWKLFVCIS